MALVLPAALGAVLVRPVGAANTQTIDGLLALFMDHETPASEEGPERVRAVFRTESPE